MRYALAFCAREYHEDGSVTFSGESFLNHTDYSVTVPSGAIEAYKAGAFIQDCCPNLSEGDREFLMTGYTPDEWNEIFSPDVEEE